MESFSININNDNNSGVRIEQDQTSFLKYKIYRNEDNWMDNKTLETEDVPVDDFLGTITVNDAKDFTFEGQGNLSGNDLLLIASEIIKKQSAANTPKG